MPQLLATIRSSCRRNTTKIAAYPFFSGTFGPRWGTPSPLRAISLPNSALRGHASCGLRALPIKHLANQRRRYAESEVLNWVEIKVDRQTGPLPILITAKALKLLMKALETHDLQKASPGERCCNRGGRNRRSFGRRPGSWRIRAWRDGYWSFGSGRTCHRQDPRSRSTRGAPDHRHAHRQESEGSLLRAASRKWRVTSAGPRFCRSSNSVEIRPDSTEKSRSNSHRSLPIALTLFCAPIESVIARPTFVMRSA